MSAFGSDRRYRSGENVTFGHRTTPRPDTHFFIARVASPVPMAFMDGAMASMLASRIDRLLFSGSLVIMFAIGGCGDDDAQSGGAAQGGGTSEGGHESGNGGAGAGSHSGGGAEGGAGGAGSIDAGWTGPCPPTLAERVRVTEVAGVPASKGFFATGMDVLGDGGSRIAVADASGVTVVRLSAQEAPVGSPHTIVGHSVSGIVAHADGTSLLVHRLPDEMDLVRLEEDGSERFSHRLVGGNDHGTEGDKYIVTAHPHYGRLRWDGSRYVAYVGHSQNWGSLGEHQGDLLWMLDETGARLDGGWDWGCSHSWNARLVQHSTLGTVFPICESDAYPVSGVVANNATSVVPGPAILGDAVEAPDGVLVVASHHDGQGYQLVMAKVNADMSAEPPVTIMAAPDKAEMTAHVARYGENYLIGWVAVDGASTFTPYNHNRPNTFAVIDESGTILLGPETIDVGSTVYDELVTHENGDVGFPVVSAVDDTGGLRVARVRYCE